MTKNSSKSRSKMILAERFKTKVCKNFVDTGVCPYQFRCMFAHGDEELRTKQMNLDDGLVTEDAIRAFKTRNYNATRRAERQERRVQPKPDPAAEYDAERCLAQVRTTYSALNPRYARENCCDTESDCGSDASGDSDASCFSAGYVMTPRCELAAACDAPPEIVNYEDPCGAAAFARAFGGAAKPGALRTTGVFRPLRCPSNECRLAEAYRSPVDGCDCEECRAVAAAPPVLCRCSPCKR